MLWAAIIGALVVTAVMLNFGTDAENFRAGLRSGLRAHVRFAAAGAEARAGARRPDPSRLIDVLVAVLPPAAAVLTTVTNLSISGSPTAS